MDEVKNAIAKMEELMRAKLLERGLYIRAFDHVLKEAKAEVLSDVVVDGKKVRGVQYC